MSTQKNWNVILGVAAIAILIIVGVSIYIFSGTNGYTGAQALKDQSPTFWVCVIIGFIMASIGVLVLVKSQSTAWGNTGFTIGVLILIAALIFGPFGRACTDKANHGVTAPPHSNSP